MFLRFALRKDVLIMMFIFTAALLIKGFSNLLVSPFLAIIGFQVFLYAKSEKLTMAGWYVVFPFFFILIGLLAATRHFNCPIFNKYNHELIALPVAIIILNISAKPGQFNALRHSIM